MRLQESKKVTLLAEASHYTTQWSGLAGWIIIWVQKRTRFLHSPPPKSGFQWCSFCHLQVSSLVPTVLSWARDPHKVQSEEATLTSECQTNPQPATFHPPRWAVNLSCNIAEGVLCTTTQTPDFTDQELRDRELLCSGFVSSTITVTLLWETVNNQSRLRSFAVPLCDQRMGLVINQLLRSQKKTLTSNSYKVAVKMWERPRVPRRC